MGSSLISGLAFLLFIAGVLIYAVILYNGLVRLRNENDRAWANIDVLLKQRHDEIPNLVETVKGTCSMSNKRCWRSRRRVRRR